MDTIGLDTEFGTLWLVEMYLYYDGPRHFTVASSTGNYFMVLWIGDIEQTAREWLLLPVTLERLDEIRSGAIDLRGGFRDSETGIVYIVRTGTPWQPMRILPALELLDDQLPLPGDCLSEVGPLPRPQIPRIPQHYEEAAE